MEFDYKDYIEQSDLDLICQRYLKECEEHFKEQLKFKIEEIEEKEKYVNKEREKYWQREKEYVDKKRELENKENELINKKDQIILEFLQKYGLDLKIGQKVWYLQRETLKSQCPTCKGTSKLFLEKDGLKYETKCPDCQNGNKIKHSYQIKESVIEKIEFSFIAQNSIEVRNKVIIEEYPTYNWRDEWEYNYIKVKNNSNNFEINDLYLSFEEAEKAKKDKEGVQ